MPKTWTQAPWQALPASAKKGGTQMVRCNFAKQCVFFAVRDEGKEIEEYLAGLYCAGNFSACARYRAALDMGHELVPDDMFPNENDFLSLFAWSVNQRQSPLNKRCRTRGPGTLPVSSPEKTAASSGPLPPARQTRSQR